MMKLGRTKTSAITNVECSSSQNKVTQKSDTRKPSEKPVSKKKLKRLPVASGLPTSESSLKYREATVQSFDDIFRSIQHDLGHRSANVASKKSSKSNSKAGEPIVLSSDSESQFDTEPLKSVNRKGRGPNRTLNLYPTSVPSPSPAEKVCRDVENLLKSIDAPRGRQSPDEHDGVTTRSSRQRQSKSKNDIIQILENDDIICLSPQSYTPEFVPLPTTSMFTVRINWKGEILKFKLCENDYCYELRRHLAKEVNLTPNELIIYFDDFENVFDDKKTLKEANIGFGAILEATRKVAASGSMTSQRKKDEVVKDPSLLRIKVQSMEKRSEAFYEIRKTAPFRELQILYSQKMNLSLHQVKFRFDGELVDLNDTPNDLDLEGDECFDVIVT